MSTTTHPNDGCVIVVDDPHGYVVPSPGVKIVGRRSLAGHLLPLGDHVSRLINMGPERARDFMPKLERKIEPRIRGKKGVKQRLKGLRP